MSQSELFFMDDGFITKMLLSEKESSIFESKFIELKQKHK